MDGWNALAQSYYISNFPHTQASPPWAAVTHQQASDAITNMQHQWNAYGRRLGATPWMAATEPMTRLAAVTAAVPNAGMLLHQGALPIGMRNELANTLHLEAPAPPKPRQAPANPDTDTPANEEAESAADAAEGGPES